MDPTRKTLPARPVPASEVRDMLCWNITGTCPTRATYVPHAIIGSTARCLACDEIRCMPNDADRQSS